MNNLFFYNPAVGEIDLINDEYVRLTSITGVSAVGQINSQATAGLSGSAVSSKVIPERQIIVNFRIRAGIDAEQAQHDMYQIFSALSEGTMTFIGRLGASKIDYIVESCVIPPNQQVIKGIATLKCPDPFFRAFDSKSAEIAGSVSLFQFPFTFPDTPFYISKRFDSLFAEIINDGEADTECNITISATAEVVNPALIDVDTGDTAKLNFTMRRGDVIRITTGKNRKKITLTRYGETSSIFNRIIYPFTFFTLKQGKNLFKYDADSGLDNMDMVMEYTAKYGAMYTNAPASIDVRIPYTEINDKLEKIAYIVRRNGLND